MDENRPATAAPVETLSDADKLALVTEWQALTARVAAEAKPLIAEEMVLRKRVFAQFFGTNPKEGTNNAPLPEGWLLKGVHKVERDLDQAQFAALFAQLPEGLSDRLLKWKPGLVTSVYKDLPEAQRRIFDECVTTKPASPALELVPPKTKA